MCNELENNILFQLNSGQPTYNTSKKTQKKKSSFVELLCRCFMGSSNTQQPPDEKSTQEELEPKQLGQQFEHTKGKKTLILDLDETLVHSSFQPMSNSDYTLSIKVQNIPFTIHVKKRPGVEYFLEKASETFEVVIYTASLAEYADPVCDLIDPKRLVSYRLFRENCTNYQGLFVKDLSKIGRDLKDLLIVDPENAIQISNFFQDDNDRELYRLLPFLQFLSEVQDVRTTKGWMEKYLTQDYIDFISMKGEYLRYNKKLQLKKQRSLLNAAEGSQIPLIHQQVQSISREDSQTQINQVSTNNPHSNNKNTSIHENILNNEAQNHLTHNKQSINNDEYSNSPDDENGQKNSKVMNASVSTQSGAVKKYKKKDLVIQLPTEEKGKSSNLPSEVEINQQLMIDEYNQKLAQPNNLNSVRTNKLESTRKLLEKGTPRTDDYFVHKTCPDEEQQVKDPNRLNKSFEKERYDIGMFNINSPIAQKDFIDFLKEPIQTSPKLSKISQYFQSQKNHLPPPSNKFCDNFKLKLLMQQTQQIEEQDIDIDPSSLQIDQIILDRSHTSSMYNNQNKDLKFDKNNNPNQKCEMINFTDDNIKN